MEESGGGFFKGVAAVGVLAAGLGVGYYFGLYLPGRDAAHKTALAGCIKGAADQYQQDWESQCKQLKLGKECKLPMLIANEMESRRRQLMEECRQLTQ